MLTGSSRAEPQHPAKMKNVFLLLAAPLTLSLAPLAGHHEAKERIAFAPEEGSRVSKRFVSTLYLGVDEMEVLINGEENPLMPEVDMEMETTSSISLTDTYGPVTNGRPQSLKRHYDNVGMKFDMKMSADGGLGGGSVQTPSGEAASKLNGREVEFAWNGESESFDATFTNPDTPEADKAMLENVSEDMDLRALLPTAPLDIGDRYAIPLTALLDVLAPGGDLALDMSAMGPSPLPTGDPEMMTDLRSMFGDFLEGKAVGTLKSIEEEGDNRIAIIDLDLSIDTANDVSETILDLMAEGAQDGMEMTLDRADVAFAIQATGELRWNLTAGRIEGMKLEGDTAIGMDTAVFMEFGGQSTSIEMLLEMSGTLVSEVSTQ